MTAPKDINPVDFARFLNTTVEDAKAILAQERQELAATGDPDIHQGYNYRTQQWVEVERRGSFLDDEPLPPR